MLEVRTRGYQGSLHKSARVFTNDPKHPQVTIGMKGKIWTPIHMNPRYAHLNGILGEKIERVVHLRGEKKEPLSVKVASVSIPDKVEVELREIEKGRRYEVKVRNKVDKETRYQGQVKLTTNYAEKPEVVIRISGNVRAPLEVRPKVLSFGRMSDERMQELKKKSKFMRRPVMVILNKGNDLKIEKVELEKSLFKVVTRQMQRGRTVQLMVEPIFDKLHKGPNEDRMKIYTNQKDSKVLEVPIRFEIL